MRAAHCIHHAGAEPAALEDEVWGCLWAVSYSGPFTLVPSINNYFFTGSLETTCILTDYILHLNRPQSRDTSLGLTHNTH